MREHFFFFFLVNFCVRPTLYFDNYLYKKNIFNWNIIKFKYLHTLHVFLKIYF